MAPTCQVAACLIGTQEGMEGFVVGCLASLPIHEKKKTMRREDRSASYKAFYQWGERDFISIPAHELEKGDEIAYSYGGDLKYGAILIEDITRVRGAGMMLQYVLPIGAIAQSSSTISIAVYWEDARAENVPYRLPGR